MESTPWKKNRIERKREFVESEIAPFSNEIEETDAIPEALAAKLAASGLHGMAVPKEYGGMGLNVLEMCVAMEELARLNQAVVRFIGGSITGLAQFGSDDLKKKYLPRIARGESRADFALSEPEAGSDAAAIKTQTGGAEILPQWDVTHDLQQRK
jgi:alkylation response protein AidB-like acyl-CoA dehydrogenase